MIATDIQAATSAAGAAQPSGAALEAPVLGWRHIKDGLPQPGQEIMGKAEEGGTAWTEKWDETEPIGRMIWWRPAPTLKLPEKYHPSASHVHPEYRDGYNQAIDDCHLVLGLDLPHNGQKL